MRENPNAEALRSLHMDPERPDHLGIVLGGPEFMTPKVESPCGILSVAAGGLFSCGCQDLVP